MSVRSKYDETLNLPKTDFSMRANLPKREPEFYSNWSKQGFYSKILKKNMRKPLYILHDGPPYANGKIHLGTALNKILKDFIIKYKNMSGFKAPFIPGWDMHGLPIELKVLKSSDVDKNSVLPITLRKMCEDYAKTQVELQKNQFQSIGVLGDFDHPYLTCNKEFEANQIEVFLQMFKHGYVYKGLKPVYYCPSCATALAESEIEYSDDACVSVYVKFRVCEDFGFFEKFDVDKSKVYFLIWTTTIWTLPANVAVCLGSKYEYSVVRVGNEFYVLASELLELTMTEAKINDYEEVCSFLGEEFENFTVFHPFLNRRSRVILGNHVTLESGTGCVHTAPGHGIEDFEVCKKYENIPVIVVVDEQGKMNDESGLEEFSGLCLNDANEKILAILKEKLSLFAVKKITHSYPHCWRCKNPVLFRATKQWFCSIESLKDRAIEVLDDILWLPDWGKIRIKNMISDRSDWCISRQRIWGVPIPAFYCKQCGNCVLSEQLIKNVAKIFRECGSNAWFEKDSIEFTRGFKCDKCGCSVFDKETDIMDVWFDSGCSHASVLNSDYDLSFPADVYLEGADQYRGWFQSSLITSIALKNRPPFKSICTHGWVVDGDGRKMSKSLLNGVEPDEIIKNFGAEILRLWVASSDYHSDIRISNEILKQLSETYRKIRNTARFMLANITDFDPNVDFVNLNDLFEIDKLALFKLNELTKIVNDAYLKFEFFRIYHAIYNFCVVDMSNFYLDVVKDRLYCDLNTGLKRRTAQTTIFLILDSLTRMIAPVISFTAEEIWGFMKHRTCDNSESVFLNDINERIDLNFDETFLNKWQFAEKLRTIVQKALELERNKKSIGSSLECRIIIYCSEFSNKNLDLFLNSELKNLFLVSGVEVKKSDGGDYVFNGLGIGISILKYEGEKCERCWNYDDSVGKNLEFKTLCCRCVDVVKKTIK